MRNHCENYLNVALKTFRIYELKDRTLKLIESSEQRSFFVTFRKVASYAAILFPLRTWAHRNYCRDQFEISSAEIRKFDVDGERLYQETQELAVRNQSREFSYEQLKMFIENDPELLGL